MVLSRIEFTNRGKRYALVAGSDLGRDLPLGEATWLVDDGLLSTTGRLLEVERWESVRERLAAGRARSVPDAVRDLLREGTLRVVALFPWAGIDVQSSGRGEAHTVEPQPQPKSPNDDASAWFVARVVDEVGEALAGVPVLVRLDEDHALSTGGDGSVRVDDVRTQFGQARIDDLETLAEAVRPRWDVPRPEPWLEPQPDHTLLPFRGDALASSILAETPHTLVVQPWVVRARLIGMYFDTNKAFILPKGLGGVRSIVKLYESYPSAKLLIVGHTDTSGDPSYNDPLSMERAELVAAYLRDDVDAWLDCYGMHMPFEKRWGGKEDNDMLTSLPDHATKPPGESSVRWFQRTRGLTLDGVAGPQTRRALITEYMARDGTTLPGDLAPICHGCGESFPEVEDTGHDAAKAKNRRVELYFFDGLMGVQPPPPGPISKPGSPEYPEWVRRSCETHDFELLQLVRDCHFSFVLRDEHEELVASEPFVLDIGGGDTLESETDGGGNLVFGDVPAGDFLLQIRGMSMFVPALAKTELRRPLRVRDDIERI